MQNPQICGHTLVKILIAEDDVVARMVLMGALKKLNHEMTVTQNRNQAWKAFQTSYFPVVISDWMMPELDGLQLARAIRRVHRDNYTYIIMLTALSGKTNYLEAMKAGADDFITKPFDEEQLAARLHVAERILGLLQHVKHLEGLLPICMYCKKIRDEGNQWQQIDHYISLRSEAKFSHSICPECFQSVVKKQAVSSG